MPIRVSRALGLEPETLRKVGAFDGFVDVDAAFYVDPHLLDTSSVEEMDGAHDEILKHFELIMRLLQQSKGGDALYRVAQNQLIFPEEAAVSLGYAKGEAGGRGVGPKLARQLCQTAKEIVAAGIEDPIVFELVGLFEKNIGADRISDAIVWLIRNRLAAFSARVVEGLPDVERVTYRVGERTFDVPAIEGKPILLVPVDCLRDLPVAEDWSDIDLVARHNEELRDRVNAIIGNTWKSATGYKVSKRQLRRTLLRHPQLLRDLIEQYREKPADPYDLETDPAGELAWYDDALSLVSNFALHLPPPTSADEVLTVVRTICESFADNVENHGQWELLWVGDKSRPERYAQRLFYGVAKEYCRANDLDLSPETDSGRGPVDFKVSRGYNARVSVEVKYTSNKKLAHGYEKQLPAYNEAEGTEHSVYLVLRDTKTSTGLERVYELRDAALARGERAPLVIVADVLPRPSASRA